ALFIAMICLSPALIARAETVSATIPLSTANVVPQVSGLDADGTMTLTININRGTSGQITSGSVNFLFRFKFPGPVTITGFPLREGSATTNGPEVINADNSSTTFGTGMGSINIGTEVNDPALLTRLLAFPFKFYINVSTSANPGGALRGQLTRLGETLASTVKMTPEAVVKPSTPPPAGATGTATITVHPMRTPSTGTVGEGSVAFMVTYNFPESVTITGLKIHEGSSTINGPAVFDSGISSSNTIVSTSGKGAINIVIPLSYALGPGEVVAMLPKLVANPTGFYVSLETTANPAGALRAQLGALAKPLENFYATNYVLTGVDEAQSLTLIGSDDLQATGGLAAVVINGTSVPFNFGGQPGQISIQVPPPSQISFSGLLYVQLQNATGLLSEPIVVASAKQENINTVATATVDAARY